MGGCIVYSRLVEAYSSKGRTIGYECVCTGVGRLLGVRGSWSKPQETPAQRNGVSAQQNKNDLQKKAVAVEAVGVQVVELAVKTVALVWRPDGAPVFSFTFVLCVVGMVARPDGWT
eukprot:250242-Pelagomonas_calceolata.AAC.1